MLLLEHSTNNTVYQIPIIYQLLAVANQSYLLYSAYCMKAITTVTAIFQSALRANVQCHYDAGGSAQSILTAALIPQLKTVEIAREQNFVKKVSAL
jgi:hypothetical protein